MGAEESLERKYRMEPGPDVQRRYDAAAARFVTALESVRRDGSADDRVFVQGVLSQHSTYLTAIDRMFRAVDRADTSLRRGSTVPRSTRPSGRSRWRS